MPTESIVLIGAGGHAKVVFDALGLVHPESRIQVLDDADHLDGKMFFHLRVTSPVRFESVGAYYHAAVGNNAMRRRLFSFGDKAAARALAVVHPAATVSRHASLADGCFVAATAVIGPAVTIGRGTIVNHAATIDHDCIVGDFCHIAPGATLCGGVVVSDEVLVGAGAVVLPDVCIGSGAIIAAGAVVHRDVLPSAVVKGVPAR